MPSPIVLPSLAAIPTSPELRGKDGSPARAFQGELARRLASGNGGAAQEIAAQRTPLSGSDAARALSRAFTQVTGRAPTPKLLSVLVAQWAHETGRGESMLNYNFGGIKGTGPSGLTAAYKTHEGAGDDAHVIVDHFRAYQNPEEGATDYVRLLHARFPAALDAAEAGDAPGFVHALKKSGYFTGSEDDYVRSVSSLAARAQQDGFDSIGSRGDSSTGAVARVAIGGPTIATHGSLPFVDSGALADELAQAAMRIAQSTPEDYRNENERLDPRSAT